jgi:hypothetical protein
MMTGGRGWFQRTWGGHVSLTICEKSPAKARSGDVGVAGLRQLGRIAGEGQRYS